MGTPAAVTSRHLQGFLFAAVLLALVATVSAQPPLSEAPGEWEQRIVAVEDVHRLYYLYKPVGYQHYFDRPLILNLHGSIDPASLDSVGQRPEVFMFGKQHGNVFLDTTRASMMWKVAEANKILVACPLSKAQPAWSPFDPTSNLEYVDAILDDIEWNYGQYVDSDRIYASGFSGGAGQTHRIGYYGASRIAAIAPLYYPMNTSLYPLDPPVVAPVGILFAANRYDPTPDVPYTEPSDSITILQSVHRWKEWLEMNYLWGSFETGPVDTVAELKFRNPPGGGNGFHVMEFYTLFEDQPPYLHSYPKLDEQGWQGNTEVWDFLRRYHLPADRSREAALDAGRVITPAPMSAGGHDEWAPQPLNVLSVSPNPFNPSTTLHLSLPEAGVVRVNVVDMLGREVAHLAGGSLPAGNHAFTFDATGLASGVYFVRAEMGGTSTVRRIVLMK